MKRPEADSSVFHRTFYAVYLAHRCETSYRGTVVLRERESAGHGRSPL